MNTYLGIMRWLWFKISGHVLFGNAPSSIETNYSRPNTRDSFSSFSNLSELFWVSNFCKNRVNNPSLKRIQRLCFNTAWSWLITAGRAKYSGGENLPVPFIPCLQWRQLVLIKIYKGKGIATSRLYQQLSYHFLNFRNHHQFEQIWFLDQGVC